MEVASGQICLAGLARGLDTNSLPNRVVSFEYSSDGTVKDQNENRVVGDFVTVAMRLQITGGTTPVDQTVTSSCELKGRIRQEGDTSKVRLKCDFGEDLADFTDLDAEDLDSIEDAFPKPEQKHIKVDVKKGKVKVTHNGVAVDTGAVDVSCNVASED